jgi:peptide/nickel transport system substrate-binding protein
MRSSRKVRVAACIASFATMAAVLAGCSSSKTSTTATATGSAKQGGVVRVAEAPGTSPTSIWPFVASNQETTTNIDQFQFLFFRPLYFWGIGDQVAVDYDISLGNKPTWSPDGKSVTITLKDWKWSNGESVTGQDVLFWINMSKAEKANSAYYTPPNTSIGTTYFPDNVVNATASGQSVTLTLDKVYNQNWFEDNELSQITPMPVAWDETAAGVPGKCSTDAYDPTAAATSPMVTDCAADYKFLSAQATDLATFASNPLWKVVDGPWTLKSFTSNGAYDITPNTKYSGPQKPYLNEVDFLPYTADTAEYNDLKSGSSSANAIDVGYIPAQDTPVYNASNPNAGNPLAKDGYTITNPNDATLDAIGYFYLNFGNTTVGGLFAQPYFGQAVQDSMDQEGMIKGIFKGWGYPTVGAIPTKPAGNPLSPDYPTTDGFSTSAAKALMTSHGWDVSTTPATCSDPGTGANQCGAGVTAGEKASFNLDYPSGASSTATEIQSLVSDAAQAGIQIISNAKSQNAIGNDLTPCTTSTASGCWEALYYGGWVYAPDYYPTGESLWATGAGANVGSYSNPKLDQAVAATTTSNNISAMYAYEDLVDTQHPVIWTPETWGTGVVINGLNIGKSDPFQGVEPEYWYYTN